MATSGTSDFSTTRDEIIKGALRIVGGIEQGETPTADQTSEAAIALNYIAKLLMVDGMPMWAMKQYAFSLTGTADYNIGDGQTIDTPKPMKVYQAFFNDGTGNVDIPMMVISRQEYNDLGDKTITGQPIQIWYEPLRNYGVAHIYPVPDTPSIATGTVTIVYQRPFEDFDSATDEPDFPQEWFETLKYYLAYSLAPEYGMPIDERQDIRAHAKEMHEMSMSFGTEEASIFFQADRREWR